MTKQHARVGYVTHVVSISRSQLFSFQTFWISPSIPLKTSKTLSKMEMPSCSSVVQTGMLVILAGGAVRVTWTRFDGKTAGVLAAVFGGIAGCQIVMAGYRYQGSPARLARVRSVPSSGRRAIHLARNSDLCEVMVGYLEPKQILTLRLVCSDFLECPNLLSIVAATSPTLDMAVL